MPNILQFHLFSVLYHYKYNIFGFLDSWSWQDIDLREIVNAIFHFLKNILSLKNLYIYLDESIN